MTATTTTTAIVLPRPAPAPAPKASALETTRVEALFASHLQISEPVTPESVREAVTVTVRRYGSQGCAALVAQEFGEHPETAVCRMRWALSAVRRAYELS